MKGCGLLVCGLALAALVAAGAAGASLLYLPATTAQLAPLPPFPAQVVSETRFRGRIVDRERVVVGIDRTGTPQSIVVTQRLTLTHKGDFAFTIPAPAIAVRAAPGYLGEPGLRRAGIVWQGFSPGRRELGAVVVLRVDAAAPALPLRIAVRRRGGATAVTFTSVPAPVVPLSVGIVDPRELDRVLVQVRREAALPAGRPGSLRALAASRVTQVRRSLRPPLRLAGTVAAGGPTLSFRAVLGNGGADRKTVVVSGSGAPTIRVDAEPLRALEILPTPAAANASPSPVLAVATATARTALAAQFRRFLGSPDAFGPSSTTYVYRTVAAHPAVAPAPRPGHHGGGTLALLLAVAGGVLALGLGVVVWAHS